jgi:hypothetical protein
MIQLVRRYFAKSERISGVPARFIVPVVVAGISLQVAVLGMYWDIGYHIDHGRDQGCRASSWRRCSTAPWTGRSPGTSGACPRSACA